MEAQDGGAGEEQVRENTMRPTPRTDALYRRHHPAQAMPDMNQSYAAFVEHARTLERELAEAVELLQFITSHTDKRFWTDARAFLKRMEQK